MQVYVRPHFSPREKSSIVFLEKKLIAVGHMRLFWQKLIAVGCFFSQAANTLLSTFLKSKGQNGPKGLPDYPSQYLPRAFGWLHRCCALLSHYQVLFAQLLPCVALLLHAEYQ